MSRLFRLPVAVILFFGLAVYITDSSAGEVKLTPDEVRATFIGIPWHGPFGAFIFRKNGTYTYKKFGKSGPLGTWSYKMQKDGALAGYSTSYTFYKDGENYRYFHSRSGKYYRAIPNRPSSF